MRGLSVSPSPWTTSMPSRTAILPLFFLLLFACSSLAQAPAPAGTDPWFGRTTRTAFQPLAVPEEGFQLEWPKKDWMRLPSAGPLSLVLASRKGDAIVVVERTTLRQALEPADITDLFAELESDAVKQRQKPLDLQARVISAGERRLVALQYQRAGALGEERVRQYSVPAGKRLYRLICVSTAAQVLSYDAIFAHIASTFVPLPE